MNSRHEDEAERIADALERIADALELIAARPVAQGIEDEGGGNGNGPP